MKTILSFRDYFGTKKRPKMSEMYESQYLGTCETSAVVSSRAP